jgi:MFS family permease
MSATSEEGTTLDDRQRLSPATGASVPEPIEAATAKRWMSWPFVRLLATNMAVGFSMSCFYLLPKHLTVSYAASPGKVGAVVGSFGLACVLVVPWLGRAVSALGLGRMLFFSQLVMAACSFAFVPLDTIGPAMLALRVLQGLATAGVMTAGVAMVCELAPAAKLGQAMGLAGAASLIMNAIALAVAEPIAARHGFAWVFVMAGAAALIGAYLARRLPDGAKATAPVALEPVGRPALLVLLALTFTAAGFHVVMAFLAPLALSRGIPAVGGFFVVYTVAALAMRTLGGGLTDRLGLRRAAFLGILVYGAFIAAIAAVGSRSLVALGLGFGVAHGVLFPALMALLFDKSQPAERARLAAFSNGVLNLGMLTVLGFGQLANRTGLAAVFVITGALVAASALALAQDRAKRPSTPLSQLFEQAQGEGDRIP